MNAKALHLGLSALQTVDGLRERLQLPPHAEPDFAELERTIVMMFYSSDDDGEGDSRFPPSRRSFLKSICRSLEFLADESKRHRHVDIAKELLACRDRIRKLETNS